MPLRHTLAPAVFVLILSPSPSRGAVTAWTDVVVRVYDANGVMAGTNRTALDQAATTLRAASIDVVWRMCSAASPCDAPLAAGELAMRIVRSPMPRNYRGNMPLGDAMVDTRSGASVLATIYFDRVLWLAEQAGADSRALLGRAIAHELGHLLLASTTHGPVGLMRALWSQDEVRRGFTRDWTFAPIEIARMRSRVDARRIGASGAWGTR